MLILYIPNILYSNVVTMRRLKRYRKERYDTFYLDRLYQDGILQDEIRKMKNSRDYGWWLNDALMDSVKNIHSDIDLLYTLTWEMADAEYTGDIGYGQVMAMIDEMEYRNIIDRELRDAIHLGIYHAVKENGDVSFRHLTTDLFHHFKF